MLSLLTEESASVLPNNTNKVVDKTTFPDEDVTQYAQGV